MNREQIMNTIKSLSMSQGFYRRLYNEMTEEYLDYLVSLNLADATALVTEIEGGC